MRQCLNSIALSQVLSAMLCVGCAALSAAGQAKLDGIWEGEIQDLKRPLVTNVDFNAQTASFSGTPAVKITRSETSGANKVTFEVVNGGQTLKFNGVQGAGRIVGDVDTGTRRIPFWLELLPAPPPPANKAEAWRQDLDVVLSRFLRYDRSFSAARRETARIALKNIRARVDWLSDAAIMVGLGRAIALAGNAHTRLYLMRNRTEVRRVPLRVWWFRNELRIVRAAGEYSELAGCRVNAVGRYSVAAAFRKVSGIKAGNTSWQRYMTAYFLTSPDILYGAQVIPNADNLPLTVACYGQSRRVSVVPLPLRKSNSPVEAWWDLSPAYKAPELEFKSALASDKAPLYLLHPDKNYSVEYLSDPSIIYIQYNRAQEMASETMDAFIARVNGLFDQRKVKGLIIDVRFNTGGDAGVGTPLVEQLAPRLKGLPVVVLTSRATFSAGITHAAQWKQFAGAVIVGEPAGDALDLWSEGGNLLLPNSRLTVHYANGFHAYSQKDYPAFKPYFADLNVATLQPDVVIEASWSEYLAGSDPALMFAVNRIRHSK